MKKIFRKIGNGVYNVLSRIFRGMLYVYHCLPRPVTKVVSMLVRGVGYVIYVVVVALVLLVGLTVIVVSNIIERIFYQIEILWRRIKYRNDSESLAIDAYEDYLDEMMWEEQEEENAW